MNGTKEKTVAVVFRNAKIPLFYKGIFVPWIDKIYVLCRVTNSSTPSEDEMKISPIVGFVVMAVGFLVVALGVSETMKEPIGFGVVASGLLIVIGGLVLGNWLMDREKKTRKPPEDWASIDTSPKSRWKPRLVRR